MLDYLVGFGKISKNDDVTQIKALTTPDITTWSNWFVKAYQNNYLAGQENEYSIGKLNQYTNQDVETNTCSLSIEDNLDLAQTANVPGKLKLCVASVAMLTDKVSFSDRLIIALIGKVKRLDIRSKPLWNTIFVKSYDRKVGNSLKDRSLLGDLKECVLITVRTNRFPLRKGKSTVIPERKQFLITLSNAITVYMFYNTRQCNYYLYIPKKYSGLYERWLKTIRREETAWCKNYQQPISHQQYYT